MENWKTKENKSSFSSQGKVRKFLNVTRKSGKSQGILVQSRKIISKKIHMESIKIVVSVHFS